jgi:5-methylcytosine-specific restriction endonuclease McrA
MSPEKREALREYMRQYHPAWRAANREAVRQKAREYRATHPDVERRRRERALPYKKQYNATHKAERRAYDLLNATRERRQLKEWRDKNHAQYLATEAAYRELNRERFNQLQRERRAANPEKYRAVQRARYAADPVKLRGYRQRRVYREKLGHEMAGSHTTYQWTVKLMEFGGCCAHCGTNERIERDHIIPLSRGGSDLIENIQPLCRSCNSRKSATVAIAA